MEKLFQKYLNGTCTPDEFNEITDLLIDGRNEEKLSLFLLNSWKEIMQQEADIKKNDQLLQRIHNQIAVKESEIYLMRLTFMRKLLKAAAVIVIGLLLSNIFFYSNSRNRIAEDVIEVMTTPDGARSNFKLPDGSDVWLNSGSTISWSRQKTKMREVELSGQAFFNVTKGDKPFLVRTQFGTVEVKGTSFDVKAYDDDDFETTLVEGIVDIHDNCGKVIRLSPGQQSIINTLNIVTVNEVNTEMITSWKEGKLVFANEPFYKVARQLERWYNVNIEIYGEKLKNLCYTGKIEMETFSEVLDLINITTPIKYKFDKNTRILKISGQ